MEKSVYRGQVICGFLTAGKVGTPIPHTVQGSTVVLILKLLFVGSFSSHKQGLGREKAVVNSPCRCELIWKNIPWKKMI